MSSSDKRLFIDAIFRATNSIDLPLIAEMVETQGELGDDQGAGGVRGDGAVDRAAGADVISSNYSVVIDQN